MSQEINEIIKKCWADHDSKSEDVVETLKNIYGKIPSFDLASAYCSILVHTLGGHLNRWDEAKNLIDKLSVEKDPKIQAVKQWWLAVIDYCSGLTMAIENYSEFDPDVLSKSSAYAQATKELVATKKVEQGLEAFNRLLKDLPLDLPSGELAKSIAIAANNLASALEEKKDRSDNERDGMIIAAKAARKYWEIAGSWREVERAEYRLAMSYLQYPDLKKAEKHGQLCKEICLSNGADAFELFFAHEVLVKVNKAYCEDYKSKLDFDMQAFCQIP